MPSEPTQKPFIVPIFIPHAGCPHRCIFCEQTQTTGESDTFPTATKIHAAISQFLSYQNQPGRWTEISFYGGNFLGLPVDRIKAYLEIANVYVQSGRVDGIRFSTRPDTVNLERMDLISPFPVSTIEIGVQSMNDSVLTQSRRGHTAQNTRDAMALLTQKRTRIGLQMMVGLPGDTADTALESGNQIARLQPDFVRIYPCIVLEGSALAHAYARGHYTPLSLNQAVDQVKSLYKLFLKANIPVIRMGLQPTDQLNAQTGIIAGPFHPSFGELVLSALWLEALQKMLRELKLSTQPLEIRMHPGLVSRINGHKHKNIDQIKSEFHLSAIHTLSDPSLSENSATINGLPLSI